MDNLPDAHERKKGEPEVHLGAGSLPYVRSEKGWGEYNSEDTLPGVLVGKRGGSGVYTKEGTLPDALVDDRDHQRLCGSQGRRRGSSTEVRKPPRPPMAVEHEEGSSAGRPKPNHLHQEWQRPTGERPARVPHKLVWGRVPPMMGRSPEWDRSPKEIPGGNGEKQPKKWAMARCCQMGKK